MTHPTNGNGSSKNRPSVCLIDDDSSARLQTSALLQSIGFEVQAFGTGSEFLLSGQVHRCDCLITRAVMRDMSSTELQQALEAARVQVPVIQIAGKADQAGGQQVPPHGVITVSLDTVHHEADLISAVRAALAATSQ